MPCNYSGKAAQELGNADMSFTNSGNAVAYITYPMLHGIRESHRNLAFDLILGHTALQVPPTYGELISKLKHT